MTLRSARSCFCATIALFGLFAGSAPVQAATYTVTTLASSGPGSLQQAVTDAMATPEDDTINFSVNGAITLANTLPELVHEGGALAIDATGMTVTIDANGRRALVVNGGAVLSLTNLTLTGAQAAFIYNSGKLDVFRSTFRGNASNSGGAIFNNGVGAGPGDTTIIDSTFSGNTASTAGGALYNAAGTLIVINSTLSGNSSPNGGAIAMDDHGAFTTVTNSILASNTPLNCGVGGVIANGGNNIEGGSSCGFGFADGSLSNTDPLIGPLLFNAPGQTQTFALMPGSPALGAAKASACPVTDQRGIGRPQRAVCDIGAYELLASPPAVNYQGLWWAFPPGSEAGWGINFAHQGKTIFATWFTYGLDGKPVWIAVVAVETSPGVYSGDLFTTTGPPFNSVPFDPSLVVETTVGTATFTFTDDNHGTFAYTIDLGSGSVTQTKSITRQAFGTLPVCVWGAKVDLAFTANFTDLWWNVPPGSEAGWGINFSHQGDVIFATWFTYDADGNGWWLAFVANKTGPGVYSGDVFTTTGPPFNAVPWDTSLVVETTIGTATLTFTDGNHATFTYTVNGISQTKTVTRQVFAPPGTACN